MNTIRTAALVAALAVMSASSLGQEKKDAPPAAATPPAANPSPVSPPAAASPPAGEQPRPPPSAEPRGVLKDDEFIPTQDIPPDEGVTFPVGI